jgi:hypothetical protein
MKEFIQLVAKMREMQKKFFKTRQKEYMTESKKLEKEVDAWLSANSYDFEKDKPLKLF